MVNERTKTPFLRTDGERGFVLRPQEKPMAKKIKLNYRSLCPHTKYRRFQEITLNQK